MAKWPDNPVYTPLSEINKGNEYEPADGIVAKDINAFIENVDYLNKAIIDLKKDLVVVVQATGQSTTDVMSQKATTDSLNLLEAKLNENIVKDPSKTYLIWKGNRFTGSSGASFKAPAGSTIDWGDGTIETFTTASTDVNTHTYTDGYNYHLIAISGLTSIGDDAFQMCSGLISVIIGNGVTSIGDSAFQYCGINLTSVTIGNSVTSIGDDAFYSCGELTSITIPNSVTSIGNSAFDDCTSLTSITIKSTTPPTLSLRAIPTTIEKIIVPKSAINAYKAATGWSTYADKIVYEVDSSDLPDTSKFAKLNEDNYFKGNISFENPILIYGNKAAITDVDGNTFYFPANLDRPGSTYTLATTSDVDAKSSFSVEVWQ